MGHGEVRKPGLILALLLVAGLAVFAWWQYSARMEAERTLGLDASRVLSEHFSRAAAVKVATLNGEVIAGGEDKGFMGILPSERTTKTPYTVDYFVDLSGMGPRSYRWDEATRTLTIDIPDVAPGKPNIDESQASSQQKGLFISRRAALELARETSRRAAAASARAASKPEHMGRARENARTVVANMAAGPLQAAGLDDVRVAVSFPWEPKTKGVSTEQWDRSRRVEEVLGERKAGS